MRQASLGIRMNLSLERTWRNLSHIVFFSLTSSSLRHIKEWALPRANMAIYSRFSIYQNQQFSFPYIQPSQLHHQRSPPVLAPPSAQLTQKHTSTIYSACSKNTNHIPTETMCKILIVYRCGCKPYETHLPCERDGKRDCNAIKETVYKPRCRLCEAMALDLELART
ncbi:hypothetical protein F5X96DRAFT_69799 [Biscogniauxia mediterranea]|nr:hypothetical protein F5X96DRAFT_69799 [Biscogniauxia mediterranea]